MNWFKKALAVALTGTMLFSAAACGGSGDASSGADATATSGVTSTTAANGKLDMRVNVASEPNSMDPTLNTSMDGGMMLQHNFEGLMKFTNDGEGNAELVEGQAESYEKIDNGDGTVSYTFKLRPDIKWSDGKEVTANDFVYSWQRLVDPATAAEYNYMIDMVVNANEIMEGTETDLSKLGITAVSDQELKIDLTYDCPYFTQICSFGVTMPLREDIVKDNDQWTQDPATYISNGPMQMSEWKHSSYIMMVPNTEYYDSEVVTLNSLKWILSDDATSMYASYKNGEVDFVEKNFPSDEIPTLLADGTMKVEPMVGTYFVCFNTEVAPFDDARVRQAFSLVIDREYITENVSRAGETPAAAFVPDGVNDAQGAEGESFREVGGNYYGLSDEEYQANCEEARSLLAEAGYPDGAGLPTITYSYNTLDSHRVIAESLQEMWQKELGVNVSLSNEDWAVFIDSRHNGDFEIARHGWIADYNDPITFLDMWVTGGGNNDANYTNEEYDQLIADAKATADPEKRMEALHAAENILMEDAPVAPIYFYTNPYLMADNINGMFYTPLGYFYFYNCTAA